MQPYSEHPRLHISGGTSATSAQKMSGKRGYGPEYILTWSAPHAMYTEGRPNDVRSLYVVVIKFNRLDTASQVIDLHRQVFAYRKYDQPMKTWFDDLYELLDECVALQAPVPSAIVRTIVIDALKGDPRYRTVLREAHRHTDWSMSVLQKHLYAAATVAGDLVGACATETVPYQVEPAFGASSGNLP